MTFKYADDTSLLVLETLTVQLNNEFDAILQWALDNNLVINISKTEIKLCSQSEYGCRPFRLASCEAN